MNARFKSKTCPPANGNILGNIPGMVGAVPGSWPVNATSSYI